jgi:hypothetical protein
VRLIAGVDIRHLLQQREEEDQQEDHGEEADALAYLVYAAVVVVVPEDLLVVDVCLKMFTANSQKYMMNKPSPLNMGKYKSKLSFNTAVLRSIDFGRYVLESVDEDGEEYAGADAKEEAEEKLVLESEDALLSLGSKHLDSKVGVVPAEGVDVEVLDFRHQLSEGVRFLGYESVVLETH